MSINVTGTIALINETKEIGAKGFKKREFVVTTEEKYPQVLLLEATGDRVSLLDGASVGDAVSVSINLKGRKWDGPNGTKYFNTLEAWKIDMVTKNVGGGEPVSAGASDDLPFATCDLACEPSPIARVLR
jgi:hypothetical protein